jgi:bifunctional DNA-binding transcriptional regulator/antitoxin component of YhaV-PrlF toxin-antitoxin module
MEQGDSAKRKKMAKTMVGASVVVSDNGNISLPEQIRQQAGIEPGDELLLVWSPPDTLMVRKLSDLAADDEAFAREMRTFRQALRSAGYETRQDIIKLVREVKAEQAIEWAQE